mmetsp:Transcript_6476/g.8886  ORF Transcript_6476/g.8886 Transcript_6476/m.8886 type:complete len:162 (-) Transcript_6476:22-507(-)
MSDAQLPPELKVPYVGQELPPEMKRPPPGMGVTRVSRGPQSATSGVISARRMSSTGAPPSTQTSPPPSAAATSAAATAWPKSPREEPSEVEPSTSALRETQPTEVEHAAIGSAMEQPPVAAEHGAGGLEMDQAEHALAPEAPPEAQEGTQEVQEQTPDVTS